MKYVIKVVEFGDCLYPEIRTISKKSEIAEIMAEEGTVDVIEAKKADVYKLIVDIKEEEKQKIREKADAIFGSKKVINYNNNEYSVGEFLAKYYYDDRWKLSCIKFYGDRVFVFNEFREPSYYILSDRSRGSFKEPDLQLYADGEYRIAFTIEEIRDKEITFRDKMFKSALTEYPLYKAIINTKNGYMYNKNSGYWERKQYAK